MSKDELLKQLSTKYVNEVQKSLSGIGIDVFNENGEYKPLIEIFSALSEKLNELENNNEEE